MAVMANTPSPSPSPSPHPHPNPNPSPSPDPDPSQVPFVLFELPGLQALLSHTHPTGYSRLGECVPQDTRGAAAYCEWLRRTLRQRKALEG